MALPEGTKLGPYQIGAQIGAGGMGEVYRATDTRLDRTVAIKVLPEHLASDPSRRERFERGDLTAFVDTPAEEQVRFGPPQDIRDPIVQKALRSM